MSSFSDAAKDDMLDALSPDTLQLHNGDPGSAGTSNQIGSPTSGSFDAAGSGKRELSAAVVFSGLTPSSPVTWVSVWASSTYLAKAEISGTTASTGAGGYTLHEFTLEVGDC